MHFILGTAGHIDHGKSSLIKALTGINPDRLPEEQKRGVTIELGFAHLQLADHQIGVVDVPGHADFVNNMVSGVGGLDLALFVVAADDGWMPQSEEHLHILSYLGIKRVIIALTKIDMCEDVEFVQELIREEIESSPIADAQIVPVSSHTGEGLEDLKAAIVEAADSIKHDIKGKSPRLNVDRVFSPKGVGTVVTGTLSGSKLSVGDSLICYPTGKKTSIRHIQMHSSTSDTATPGSRVGLNLSDLAVDQRGKPGAKRGCLIAPEGLHLSDHLDVYLERLERGIPGQSATARPLKNTESVLLHIGSDRIKARVILNHSTILKPSEHCFAQLRLEHPIACSIGDPFVLRDGGQQGTLAGGKILNPLAEPRQFRTPERAAQLETRLQALGSARTLLLDELQSKGYISENKPIRNSPFSDSAIQQAASKLHSEKKAVKKEGFLLDKQWWHSVIQESGDIVKTYHRAQPDATVMPIEQWRHALSKRNYEEDIQTVIEEGLYTSGFVRKELGIAHEEHILELPANLQSLADSLSQTLLTAGLNPPILVDFIDSSDKEQVLKFLVKNGTFVELSPKAVIHSEHCQNAIQTVIEVIRTQGPATSSDIRQHLETSRKVLIPLLEMMDTKDITIRNGDHRELHPKITV